MTKKEKRKFQELLLALNTEIARARQEEERAKKPYQKDGPRYMMDKLPRDAEAITGACRGKQALETAKKMITDTFPEVYAEVVTDAGI